MFVISASFFCVPSTEILFISKSAFYIYLNKQTYILRLFLPEKGTQIYLLSKKQLTYCWTNLHYVCFY